MIVKKNFKRLISAKDYPEFINFISILLNFLYQNIPSLMAEFNDPKNLISNVKQAKIKKITFEINQQTAFRIDYSSYLFNFSNTDSKEEYVYFFWLSANNSIEVSLNKNHDPLFIDIIFHDTEKPLFFVSEFLDDEGYEEIKKNYFLTKHNFVKYLSQYQKDKSKDIKYIEVE